MATFRGRRIRRGGGGGFFPMPPTHMADGSVKYPDGEYQPEHHDYASYKDADKPKSDKKEDF